MLVLTRKTSECIVVGEPDVTFNSKAKPFGCPPAARYCFALSTLAPYGLRPGSNAQLDGGIGP